MNVSDVTPPFVGSLQFPTRAAFELHWLVGLMNVVNFSDGVDGLAAGLCTIDGIAFSIIIFALPGGPRRPPGWRATTAGASLGFLLQLPAHLGVQWVTPGQTSSAISSASLRWWALEDRRGHRPRCAPIGPSRPVPGHRLRGRQAAEVPAQALVGGRQPLPPPDGPIGLQPAQDRRLPVRVDAAARRSRDGASLRALLAPQRPLRARLEPGHGADPVGRPGRQRVPRLRAGDLQVQAAASQADAQARSRYLGARDRGGGAARHRDRDEFERGG